MKTQAKKERAAQWLHTNRWNVFVLSVATLLLAALRIWAAPAPRESTPAAEYAAYETAVVTSVLRDSTLADETADGALRGDQLLLAEVTSGQYEGETLQADNFVGPLYGVPVQQGDRVVLTVSVYADGSHTATVYEHDRTLPLLLIAALFLLATVLVGGKTGAKSLLALGFTLYCLFFVLLPLLMKGAPTLPAVLLLCTYITVVSLTVLGGVHKKTVCAMLGTVAGVVLALLFALLAQWLCHINGLRLSDVEPLLQLRQQGVPIGLRHLLTGGIIISTLGAVMDVTIGISSALCEIHAVDPALGKKQLFLSGMRMGQDMVGTITNTLILAFLGNGFTLILYLYSLGLAPHQLLSSAYFAVEVISGVSGSIGVILAIPLTALICAALLGSKIRLADHRER